VRNLPAPSPGLSGSFRCFRCDPLGRKNNHCDGFHPVCLRVHSCRDPLWSSAATIGISHGNTPAGLWAGGARHSS